LPALAANHYVRAGATGAANGNDWTNAYTSLPSSLIRGDTYYIADGSYAGRTFSTATSGTTLITIKKATVADHGTDTGWNSTYGDGQVQFTSGLQFTTNNWLLDGQTGGGAENNWNQNFGIKITETNDANAVIKIGIIGSPGAANNITIRHVEMQGKGSVSSNGGSYSNDGLAVYGAIGVTLSYFWMHGIGRGPLFISAQNVLIEHGWVQSYFGSPSAHSEIASIWSFAGKVGDMTFRYNLFTDIQSTGGIMWDNSANTSAKLSIYGNVFYKPAGAVWGVANGLIGGWTGGGGEEFHNASVYNNTFINVDQESLSTLPNIASNNTASNNLFYNCQSPNFSKFATHDYNHYINSGGTHSETHGTSAASGDPFVNFSSFNFRLKAATSAGQTLASPLNLDAFGLTRGADGNWDRGAFEFVSGGAPTLLPAPQNLRVVN
jgi:hypothetical protein